MIRTSGPEVLVTADDFVSAVGWSCDGTWLATASLDGTTRVVGPDGTVHRVATHEFGATALAWSPNAPTLAVGGQDGRVQVWSAARGAVAEVRSRGWVTALRWRPDGGEVAAAIGREVLRLTPEGVVRARHEEHPATVTCLDYTPDGRYLGAGTYGGIWWYQGAARPTRRSEWKGSLLALEVAPNGRWAVSGNQDASIHCWRLWRDEELAMSGYPHKVEHLAWDRGSRWLAVGNDSEVTVWDFGGKGPKGSRPKQLDGHARRIVAVAFEPRGSRLLSAGTDGRVCLWDVERSRRLLTTLSFPGELSAAAWSPDGSLVAVGQRDGVTLVRAVDE